MIDFVTLVYSGDTRLLDIQARSFAANVSEWCVGSILIVVNDKKFETVAEEIRENIVPKYEGLAGRVRIVSHLDLGSEGEVGGWFVQQALKIAAARLCKSKYMVILDAKNHFVHPTGLSNFIDEYGRPFTHMKLREVGSTQRAWLDGSLEYFGVDPRVGDEPAMPTSTPFCIRSSDMREMLDEIEEREQESITKFFLRRVPNRTEFLLTYAFLMKSYRRNIDLAMNTEGAVPICFFRTSPTGVRREEFLQAIETAKTPSFGIHQARYHALSATERKRIAALWAKGGISPTEADALAEINELAELFPPPAPKT